MKYAAILTLCLLFVAGCFEKNSAWIMGNPESDGAMAVRAGTEVMPNLEVGGSILYSPSDEVTVTTTKKGHHHHKKSTTTTTVNEADDWYYGIHAVMLWPDLIKGVTPYAGGQARIGQGTFDIDDTIQPIGGVTVGLSSSVSLFSEYQHESLAGEDNKVMFGVRFKF